MKRFSQNSLFSITLCSMLLSCEDTDVCDRQKLMEKKPSLVVVFENPQGKRGSINSLYVEDQSGKVLYENSSEIKEADLPLNFNNGSVDLYFKRSKEDTRKAKITVKGRPEEYYVSIACGYRLVYKDLSYNLHKDGWIKDIHKIQKQIIDEKEYLAIEF